jgi:hypothetical protein
VADLVTAGDLAQLQAIQAETLVDSCVITDPATEVRVLDEETGQYVVTAPAAVVYAGTCGVVDPTQGLGVVRDAGEQSWTSQQRLLKLPVAGSAGVSPGHMVRITAAAYDADLVDRRFRVDGIERKSMPACRRVRVTEVTGRA